MQRNVSDNSRIVNFEINYYYMYLVDSVFLSAVCINLHFKLLNDQASKEIFWGEQRLLLG